MQTLKFSNSSNPRRQTFSQPFLWLATCLFSATLLFAGCGDDDFKEGADSNGASNNAEYDENMGAGAPPSDGSHAAQAEAALANRQLGTAQTIYSDWLQESPNSGQAAAGLAITEILLLLDSAPITKILTENFGARRAINSSDMIYGSDGMLYWLSRGVSWKDQGQYQGILSLIGDKLPWTRPQLESLTVFVEKLTQPINLLIPNFVSIANHLHKIDKNLQIAMNDPNYTKTYIPGEIFHNDRLSLTLAKTEIAFVQSALAAARAAIHFTAAYLHDWTLEKAFGAWRSNAGQTDDAPIFVPAFGAEDYSVRYLDQHLFREVVRPEQLSLARTALADSLKHIQNSIVLGIQNEKNFVLQWNLVQPAYLHDVLELLNALETAIFQPTDIPFTQPPTKADFSPLFTGQKQLSTSIPWMRRVDTFGAPLSDDSTAEGKWIINYAAQKSFLLDDIYTSLPQNEKTFPSLTINSLYDTLKDVVLKIYIERVEDAYLLAR